MRHGGARQGAGRPRKNDKYAPQIASLENSIADHLPQLLANLMRLADGVVIKEIDGDGVVDVYAKPPDRKANEYLINRIAGTPTQRIDLDTDPDGTLEITAAAMTEAAKELAEWRRTQSAMLSSLPSASPMPPTSPTST